MRVLLQRVKTSSVTADEQVIGKIASGLLLLVGITHQDNADVLKKIADKIINLRIFEDDNGKMNLSALDVNADILVVSQFTLYADCRKGRRPGFSNAADPTFAEQMIEQFCGVLQQHGIKKIATGKFGANMQVSLINDGPVTIFLDSDQLC